MLRKLYFLLIVFTIIHISISCTSTSKTVYFYNVQDTTYLKRGPELKTPIQENDILSISISSLNSEASAIFNPPVNNNIRSTTVTGNNTEPGGYLVSSDGTIQLPVLGSMKAAGWIILRPPVRTWSIRSVSKPPTAGRSPNNCIGPPRA